jgi:hypothetical protein
MQMDSRSIWSQDVYGFKMHMDLRCRWIQDAYGFDKSVTVKRPAE